MRRTGTLPRALLALTAATLVAVGAFHVKGDFSPSVASSRPDPAPGWSWAEGPSAFEAGLVPVPDVAILASEGPRITAWAAALHAEEVRAVEVAVASLEADVASFVAAVRAAEAAAAARARPAPRASSSGASVSGDCYASDLPDYIVDRESGGNPNARNPSGAWGCAQFMPGTWNGTCSDLGSHGSASVAAQNECANRLWAGGAGSSHWAATR